MVRWFKVSSHILYSRTEDRKVGSAGESAINKRCMADLGFSRFPGFLYLTLIIQFHFDGNQRSTSFHDRSPYV